MKLDFDIAKGEKLDFDLKETIVINTGEGGGGEKEVILVDIAQMLGMYDGKQDVELFLNLSKRYANGDIAIIGKLDNAYGAITGMGYQEDENGNVIMADWSILSATWYIDPEGAAMDKSNVVVYGLSYIDGGIGFANGTFPLVSEPASEQYARDVANTALNSAKEYANGKISEASDVLKDYVDEEIATFAITKIVDELPEEGLPNREYFVRKSNSTDPNDLFDEYAWINRGTEEAPDWGWEFKGTKKLEIDLSDYVKFTNRADANNYGVVKAWEGNGIQSDNGELKISFARNSDIEAKSNNRKPIVPVMLDYAWKLSATTNTETWTDDDKAAACETIGAVEKQLFSNGGFTEAINAVYAVNRSGNLILLPPTESYRALSLMWRDVSGRSKVNNPVHPKDCANKDFVENLPDYFTPTDEQKAKWKALLESILN